MGGDNYTGVRIWKKHSVSESLIQLLSTLSVCSAFFAQVNGSSPMASPFGLNNQNLLTPNKAALAQSPVLVPNPLHNQHHNTRLLYSPPSTRFLFLLSRTAVALNTALYLELWFLAVELHHHHHHPSTPPRENTSTNTTVTRRRMKWRR